MRSDGPELVGLVEGHARFCRRCGHDLVGLSGERCPRCKRTLPALVYRPKPTPGSRYVVLVAMGMGLVLAAVGWQECQQGAAAEPEPSRAAPAAVPLEHASPVKALPVPAGATVPSTIAPPERVGLRPDGYTNQGAR
jgi:hypothetical protein